MRNAFLGSNTPSGFFSYYDNILEMQSGHRLFILKGGSGTGKSTLMKRVLEFASSSGLDAEAYHCSSDIASLDGVLIPKLHMAIVDGTSPHAMDTRAYGVYDEIVNLGEHVDGKKMGESAQPVKGLLKQKADCYATAYSYIAAAGALYRDVEAKYAAVTDESKMNAALKEVTTGLKLEKRQNPEYGKRRRLFLSALTPSGYVDYTEQLQDAANVIELEHGFDTLSASVLERAANAMNLAGYDLEYFCSPLDVTRPLAIYCKQLDTAVISKSFLSSVKLIGNIRIDMDTCVKPGISRDVVKQNMNEAMILLTFGYERMGKAASYHQELERLYKPAVDFAGVNRKLEYILEQMRSV